MALKGLIIFVIFISELMAAVRWTWDDVQSKLFVLQGRAGAISGRAAVHPHGAWMHPLCWGNGCHYDLATLHCYDPATSERVHYNGYNPVWKSQTECVNIGGGAVTGQFGYQFSADPQTSFLLSFFKLSTNQGIAGAGADQPVYQTARTASKHAIQYYLKFVGITISFADSCLLKLGESGGQNGNTQIVYNGQTTGLQRGGLALLSIQKNGLFSTGIFNGYCGTRFPPCTEHCNNPDTCNSRSECWYDFRISHCVQASFRPPAPPVTTPTPTTKRPTKPPVVDKCGPIGADRDTCEAKGCQFCCNTMTCIRVGAKTPPSCYNGGCVGDCFRPDVCNSRADHCHYDEDTGSCIDCTYVKLQLAFVVDFSSTGAIASFQQLANLTATFKNMFRDPEFAVTSFSDWDRTGWPDTKDHNDPEENGDTRLTWTSADKNLGWKRERMIADGRQVIRLMILVENQFVNPEAYLGRPGGRTPSKGDGTDTCTNNMPVTRKLMRDVLVRDLMSVIGVFTVDENKEVIAKWNDLFAGMKQVQYSSFDSKTAVDELTSHIRALVVGQNTHEKCMPPTNKTRPPPIVDRCGPIGTDRDTCEAKGCLFCCNTMACVKSSGAKKPPNCYNGGCIGDCFRPDACNSRPNHCQYDEDTGRCIDCTYVKLQLAFLVDTASQSAVNSFKELSKLATSLKKMFRDPEFAITSYADWERSAWGSVIGHNDPDNCYRVVQQFTTDDATIVSVASKMTATQGSIKENGDTGLVWTSASKELGWKRERMIADGRQVIRLMILVDNKFLNPEGILYINGSRTVSKGDGTDTCRNNLPVTRKLLRDVLVRDMMSVIGFFTVDEIKDVIVQWDDLFAGMMEVLYASFDSTSPMDDLASYIRAFVAGQNMNDMCATMGSGD
ncbi:hypothetical protein Ocin01_14079 [Orchesella cincta]|uniref:VWFA domain-containing protein n=1 Tax=Orchesella cincta TaxID=48709 RepID=A0A1D2MHX7_ORCCI|nr:hypothetical protein Ocin01_14079 [Orchesella cincta]